MIAWYCARDALEWRCLSREARHELAPAWLWLCCFERFQFVVHNRLGHELRMSSTSVSRSSSDTSSSSLWLRPRCIEIGGFTGAVDRGGGATVVVVARKLVVVAEGYKLPASSTACGQEWCCWPLSWPAALAWSAAPYAREYVFHLICVARLALDPLGAVHNHFLQHM